jgi:hypothetical protein
MQGFFKNMYKFIGVQLKYKSTIMNQLKILMIFITYLGLQTQVNSMRFL